MVKHLPHKQNIPGSNPGLGSILCAVSLMLKHPPITREMQCQKLPRAPIYAQVVQYKAPDLSRESDGIKSIPAHQFCPRVA